MGLGSLLHDITNGVTLGGMDMSILSTIPLPDPEAEEKCEAMGLPDPVALAALIALGAIPDPMAMLNAMMSKAEKRIQAQEQTSVLVDPPASELLQVIHQSGREADGRRGVSNGSNDVPKIDPPSVKFKFPGMAEGKSFVEAFREMEKSKEEHPSVPADEQKSLGPASGYLAAAQLLFKKQEEHAAKQGKEALQQAKVAVDRAREVAQGAAQSAAMGVNTVVGTSGDSKGVAQVFSGVDEEMSEGRHIAGSLSALLSGSQNLTDLHAAAPVTADKVDKICISKLPKGVTEAAVRLDCARHGAVTSVVLQGDGSAAYVTYANADMALSALRRMIGRAALGSLEPLDVRLVAEIPEHVRVAPAQVTEVSTEQLDPAELPEYLRPKEDRKKEKRSRSRQKSRSKSRKKKRSKSRKKRRRKKSRSKSRDRWLDRSRSNSHTATGQYIRATGCTSSVRPWEQRRKTSSSSSSRSSRSKSKDPPKKDIANDDKRPVQVAVQGCWAQFQFRGNVYYYNIQTGQTQWDKPKDFEASSTRRYREAASTTSKSATGGVI